MKWRIYYADGSTFGDEEGTPFRAPPLGVVAIGCYEDGSRQILRGWDYYYWREPYGWWGSDLIGTLDQFSQYPELCSALKIGRMMNSNGYRDILARVDAEVPR